MLCFVLWAGFKVRGLCKMKPQEKLRSCPNVNEGPAHESLLKKKFSEMLMGWTQGPELFHWFTPYICSRWATVFANADIVSM